MSFKEVIGHDLAVRILQSSLRQKRLGISYLFQGPNGIGKSFTARQFAKSLNCEARDIDSCDRCASCSRIDGLRYPDLHWIDIQDDSENIKIGQIRQMQEAIILRPFEGMAKVFVINNCQRLTEDAANCLLKVIEEPPWDSVIILIATSARLVLPTIASRCRKIRFSNLRRQSADEFLRKNYNVEPLESRYLVYYLDGRIAEALSLRDTGFLPFKERVLNAFIENAGRAQLESICKDKLSAQHALSVLMSWFRDVLFTKLSIRKDALINQDRVNEASAQAEKYSYGYLFSALDTLARSLEYLKSNANIKLVLDNISASLLWEN